MSKINVNNVKFVEKKVSLWMWSNSTEYEDNAYTFTTHIPKFIEDECIYDACIYAILFLMQEAVDNWEEGFRMKQEKFDAHYISSMSSMATWYLVKDMDRLSKWSELIKWWAEKLLKAWINVSVSVDGKQVGKNF